MHFVVCVKQVPDTSEVKQYTADMRFDRASLQPVVNPFDEYAIEEALRLKEGLGGDVTVVTMGPVSAEEAIRRALSMGADQGILVTDDDLAGSDWLVTARVLAAAIRTIPYDLVLTGMESTDARTGLVPAGLAEILGLPSITQAEGVQVEGDALQVRRQIEGGATTVTSRTPAVVSVVKGANEPRYPNLKGIMSAKRKEVRRLSSADLGFATSDVGLAGSRTRVVAVEARSTKQAGETVVDLPPEEGAERIADFLAARGFL